MILGTEQIAYVVSDTRINTPHGTGHRTDSLHGTGHRMNNLQSTAHRLVSLHIMVLDTE